MTYGQPTREYWDELYRRNEYVYGTEPNRYLVEKASQLRPGMKALVVGDGEGRNGVWLASRGLVVVSVERSCCGVEKARRLAHEKEVELEFECSDLLQWTWPREEFDIAVAVYLHLGEMERGTIHRHMENCLKPGGLLLLEAFRRSRSIEPGDGIAQQYALYTTGLLRRDFCDFEFIELLEGTVALNEGAMHQGQAEIVRLFARKKMQF